MTRESETPATTASAPAPRRFERLDPYRPLERGAVVVDFYKPSYLLAARASAEAGGRDQA